MTSFSSWDKHTLTHILLHSSQLAISMQAQLQIFEKEIRGCSEVYTNVDVEIENKIISTLRDYAPQSKYVGEESIQHTLTKTTITQLLAHDLFMIDPIDGTNNFINKLPNWAISIGHIHNFEFMHGAIALPILGELFISDNDTLYAGFSLGQFNEQNSPTISEYIPPPLTKDTYQTYATANIIRPSIPRIPHKFQIIRSCVYGIAKVLTSSYFAYIGKAKIWDFAACIGLFRALNKKVYYYNPDTPEVLPLPWTISEEHWKHDYTTTRYPLIFTHSYEHALKVVGLTSS